MAKDCGGNTVENIGQIYVISAGLFCWWAFHLILEKYANMTPVIRSTASLEKIQDRIDTHNMIENDFKQKQQKNIVKLVNNENENENNQSPIQKFIKQVTNAFGQNGTHKNENSESERIQSSKILMKLTKSIDKENKYRIKQRASMIFTLFAFRFILFIISMCALIASPGFIKAHFWDLKECTVFNEWLQYAAALIVSAYGWECAMLASYARVDAIVYVHHWLTILAAANIMYGLYSPLASNYGMFHLAFNPVVKFCTAFRFEYSNKYPVFTRKLCKFSVIYTATILVCYVL